MKSNHSKVYQSMIKDLSKVRYPQSKSITSSQREKIKKAVENTPPTKPLYQPKLPLPPKETFLELTSARNQLLITPGQQKQLQHTIAGFFGLSVGSHAALTWMMISRADYIKISDPDTIDPTNLNRLRFSWDTITHKKTSITKQQLLEINPYAKITTTTQTDPNTVSQLIQDTPSINIIVDSIDDLQGKILLRQLARAQKIPLISCADVGDNVMIDIERYDINPQPQPFFGRVPNLESIDFSSISPQEKAQLIIKLVGFNHNSEAMLNSLINIKKKIPTWPQLGSTATIAGGVASTLIKKIVLNEQIESGRYYLSLDSIFDQSYHTKKRIQRRKHLINQAIQSSS